MCPKPTVFVASSVEGLEIAEAIHCNLEYSAEVTPWSTGIFSLSRSALESLLESAERFDFAVFVLTADDVATIRGASVSIARDNVIFELGLFIGKLGKNRCFFVIPRGGDALHLPTDLVGLTPATFDSSRSDRNWQAALVPACFQIKAAIRDLGARTRARDVIPSTPLSTALLTIPDSLVVDQQLVAASDLSALINEGALLVGQTFTADRGGLLVGISIDVHSKRMLNPDRLLPSYSLKVAIHDVLNGFPAAKLTEVVLGTDHSLIHEFIGLPSQIVQVAKRPYAIVASYIDAPARGGNQWLGNWNGC
ncbi:MAG TPA: nucleotide-binding protein, partial [Gemmatimonadales bacterium]|nr:nucleotide-binding protein [Gemmatimonadales bacterium]